MLIERPEHLKELVRWKDSDLIKVVTGIRRCGKSVLLFEIFSDWLRRNGVASSHILKVNLEDKQNEHLRNSDALYNYISSRVNRRGKYYVLIDEIQYVDGFEDVLNSFKNEGCDVYVTGSNSKLLSSDINTALRGRSININVFPLSFAEYFSAAGGNAMSAFNEYLRYGGLPYVATQPDTVAKTEYLRMMESTVASRDIIDRYALRNESVFNAVYDFLCSNIGCTVSANKIANTLKSNGFTAITADTVLNYLEYLCDAFLFYKVYRYDIKGKGYLKTLNKYYIADLGLRNARENYRQLEVSHLIENIVYLELLRRGYIVDIGKNNAQEIDFVANRLTGERYYIQVTVSLATQEVKERELAAFNNLADGYKKIVITMDTDPFTQLGNGYKKVNIIDFLLDGDALEKI